MLHGYVPKIQEKSDMKKSFFLLMWAFIFAMMLAACGNSQTNSPPVSSLSVEMSEFKFNPADMTVFAGKEITLTLVNNGGVEHDFAILKKGKVAQIPFDRDKQGSDILVDYKVGAKQSGVYTFILPEAGEYQVICSIQGHMEAGMQARLIGK
jgi:uncharacterized cupredoxin-like copper-binding protein